MASEWRQLLLGDLGPIVTGKTPSTSVIEHFGGSIPFITPRDMDGRKKIDHTERYLTEKGRQAVANSVVPAGSVMVSCIGSDMGKVAIADRECVTNQQINSIVVTDEFCSDYVYYDLSLRRDELRSMASGSALPILNKGHFSQIDIELPELQVQRAIAHILGSLDDKIELNRKMNETLEAMARAIFKSWFIDFDPVRAKADDRDPGLPKKIADLFPDSFEDSELGEIPKGWRVGNIGEIAVNMRDGIRPEEITSDTPYIGLEHMPRKCIALSEWGHAEEVTSNKFKFEQGNILFGKLRPYFHKVGIAPIDGICSTDVLVVVPKNSIWYGLVLSHLSSDEFVSHADATSTGTKMPRTNWADLARYQIAIPPEKTAKAFNDMIMPMLQRIGPNIHHNFTLAAIRDALLPKLISGEIRVKDAEKVVEGVALTPKPENVIPLHTKKAKPTSPEPFREAILIAALVRGLAKKEYPLGRFRYTKMSYFVHRKANHDVTTQYMKKAAGPYNPRTRYKGPEEIALKNGYIAHQKHGDLMGFIVGDKISDIDKYLDWYGYRDSVKWVIDNFRYRSNEDLELLSTVDLAALELKANSAAVTAESIRQFIDNEKAWQDKLKKDLFSSKNIQRALNELATIFS